MSDEPDKLDLANITPENYNLPLTHTVQALSEQYIQAPILTAVLESTFPGNWHLVTKLSYHVVVIPRKLTDGEIRSLQRKTARALKKAATM